MKKELEEKIAKFERQLSNPMLTGSVKESVEKKLSEMKRELSEMKEKPEVEIKPEKVKKESKKEVNKPKALSLKKEETPSCEELLKTFKARKEKSRKYSNKPTPTAGKTVEKAVAVAVKKVEEKDGKISASDEEKVIKSFEKFIESIKNNKSLIKKIIDKLESLL